MDKLVNRRKRTNREIRHNRDIMRIRRHAIKMRKCTGKVTPPKTVIVRHIGLRIYHTVGFLMSGLAPILVFESTRSVWETAFHVIRVVA
jgi:hypothetical protein